MTTAAANPTVHSAFAPGTGAAAGPAAASSIPELFLERPDGRIAYTDQGHGPLVIMAPGFGDLKEEYRFLAPALAAAGYRAITMDLRGHGQSSVGWDDHTCAALGSDMLALAAHLGGGRAILIGNSMAGGAAAWAAAEAPDALAGLVLIDPFARNVPMSWSKAVLFKAVMHTAFVGPWAPAAWGAYYASLYPTQKPADFADYKARLVASLKEPGRMAALQAMMRTDRNDVEPRLGAIRTPALVVMGSRDPDFDDPAGEAATMAGLVKGKVAMIAGAGHYPHAEMPEATVPAILTFLTEAAAR
jgi:pimeloyl-ACP methyl ester carboxylesterase